MSKSKFNPITRKVNTIILVTLIIGIGIVTGLFAYQLSTTIGQATDNNLQQQSDLLYSAIENFMLVREAPRANELLSDIKAGNEVFQIILYRSTGTEAFTDNNTIKQVNANLERESFDPTNERAAPMNRPLIQPQFDQAAGNIQGELPLPVTFTTVNSGNTFTHLYTPLINKPGECTPCHGTDHVVRGVIDIQYDISESVNQQRLAVAGSGGLFLVVLVLITTVLARYLRRNVIRPIKVVGDVCDQVTNGDFSPRVDIRSNDEIGLLGDRVNKMVNGLRERFELSKYVSSSTLQALKDDEKGRSLPVTMFFSDIRGFTSYSETKTPDEIVTDLNHILTLQSEIIVKHGGDIDKYVGDEIVAMFTETDGVLRASRAALEIQQELSGTDSRLKVGIGLHMGEVVLGRIGSEKRADFTVIGDNVNTASRLCSAAGAGEVIISNESWLEIKEEAQIDGPYKVKAKGKQDFIKVFKLTGLNSDQQEPEQQTPEQN